MARGGVRVYAEIPQAFKLKPEAWFDSGETGFNDAVCEDLQGVWVQKAPDVRFFIILAFGLRRALGLRFEEQIVI
jgi:hypothetical protein